MEEEQETVIKEYRPISVLLQGQNDTLEGYLNITFKSQKTEYDEQGAAVYVIAVVLVYGLSMVLLIGSLAKKNMKDKSQDIEEGQVSQYLNDVPHLKERSQRDQYKELKSNIVQIVNSKVPPDEESRDSSNSSCCSERHTQEVATRTPLHRKDKKPIENVVRQKLALETEKSITGVSPLLSVAGGKKECSSEAVRKKTGQNQTNNSPSNANIVLNESPVLRNCSTAPWGGTRVYSKGDSNPIFNSGSSGYNSQLTSTFDDPVQEWLYSPYNFSSSNKHDAFKPTSLSDKKVSLPTVREGSAVSKPQNASQNDVPLSAFNQLCTCPDGSFRNGSFVPTSPQLNATSGHRTPPNSTSINHEGSSLKQDPDRPQASIPRDQGNIFSSHSDRDTTSLTLAPVHTSGLANGGPYSKTRLAQNEKRKLFEDSVPAKHRPFALRSLEENCGQSYEPYSRSDVCYNSQYAPLFLDETSDESAVAERYTNNKTGNGLIVNSI